MAVLEDQRGKKCVKNKYMTNPTVAKRRKLMGLMKPVVRPSPGAFTMQGTLLERQKPAGER